MVKVGKEPWARLASELVEHFRDIRKVPVLGKLAVFDAPDVNGPEGEGFTCRGYAANGLTVGRRVGRACNHFVAGNDAILDPQLKIGHRGDNSLKILNLGGKTGRTSSGVLDVSLGKKLGERAGVVRIDRGHVSIKECVANFPGTGC